MKRFIWFSCAVLALPASAGPYSQGLADPANPYDAPVPGFTGPHGDGMARLDDGFGGFENPDNRVNPLFFAWAEDWGNYVRSDSQTGYNDPLWALGPVTGEIYDVVSLGDMTSLQITSGNQPGRITLLFAQPIRNRSGADFVVFENGFISGYSNGTGLVMAELAHVEVSQDGINFHRFPSASLTAQPVGGYGPINPTDVHNLAGKHVNAEGESWGTPFDIGQLGLSQITHVRIVDIPGDGSFKDSLNHSIYDAWRTFGSGGFDLEAVGAVSVDMTYAGWPSLDELPTEFRGRNADPDGDGLINLLEYAYGLVPWEADAPGAGWNHSVVSVSGSRFFELTTLRDERLVDIKRELQASSNMTSWETIAVSLGGGPFQAVGGHSLQITDESAGTISSVGVIRRDRIRDLNPVGAFTSRFYQLKITEITP